MKVCQKRCVKIANDEQDVLSMPGGRKQLPCRIH